jgi:hypothetical protein
VGLGVKHDVDGIASSRRNAFDASTAAVLSAEGLIGHPFEIAVLRENDDDLVLRDQVFVIDVGGFIRNIGQALIAEFIFDFAELFDHKLHDVVFARKEAVVLRDVLGELACSS